MTLKITAAVATFLLTAFLSFSAAACGCDQAEAAAKGCDKAGKANPAEAKTAPTATPKVVTAKAEVPKAFASAPAVGTKAACPISGEVFTVTADSLRSEHGGKHYVFCCAGCKPRFDGEPQKYM